MPWLIFGPAQKVLDLSSALNQAEPELVCPVLASARLLPYQADWRVAPWPALLYGRCQDEGETHMFVFQYLSQMAGPWQGVMVLEGGEQAFLGVYLARFLQRPLLLQMNHWLSDSLSESQADEQSWSLNSPLLTVFGEQPAVLERVKQTRKNVKTALLPDFSKTRGTLPATWIKLLKNLGE